MQLSMSESFACSCFMLSDSFDFVLFLRWIVKHFEQKQSREAVKGKVCIITVISLSAH